MQALNPTSQRVFIKLLLLLCLFITAAGVFILLAFTVIFKWLTFYLHRQFPFLNEIVFIYLIISHPEFSKSRMKTSYKSN